MGAQDLMRKFYDVDNLVTVKIELPTWEELKAAQPAGRDNYQGHRYEYHKATSITISGSKYPEQPATFKDVGVIKKSYFGSFDTNKPSMRVDFTRFDKSLEDEIEKLIGTKRITLNNCKQDPGYLRQPLVYELFRQAEIPYFNCGFAKVYVNDIDMGLYVNMEPFRKPYIKRNFKHDSGNAYEIEFGQDLNIATLDAGNLGYNGFSDYEDKKDLRLAAQLVEKEGLAGVKKAFNFKDYLKFWAMECLVKHRDGYNNHQNNSFFYNDVKAVAEPTVDDLNIKLVPSGVDLTLSKDPAFYLWTRAIVPKTIAKDEASVAQYKDQVKKYCQTVFSKENNEKSIEPFIKRLEATMKAAGLDFDQTVTSEIELVRKSIKDAETAYQNLVPKE